MHNFLFIFIFVCQKKNCKNFEKKMFFKKPGDDSKSSFAAIIDFRNENKLDCIFGL